jgi:hypothetical protein
VRIEAIGTGIGTACRMRACGEKVQEENAEAAVLGNHPGMLKK